MEYGFMEEMLNQQIKKCNHCGRERERLTFEDLPTESKKEFEETDDIEYCLYCPNCDQYSAILGGGSSFDEGMDDRKTKFRSIPLNGPCPCGSGKKYKRCCGKL
jgi:hypothetical protein